MQNNQSCFWKENLGEFCWNSSTPKIKKSLRYSNNSTLTKSPAVIATSFKKDVKITITPKKQNNEKTLLEIHVEATIVDKTYDGVTMEDATHLKSSLEQAIQKWNRDDIEGYTIVATCHIDIYTNEDGFVGNEYDYQDSEGFDDTRTLIYMDSTMKSKVLAAAETNEGKYIKVNSYKLLDKDLVNTLMHEFGHLFGILYHSNEAALARTNKRVRKFIEEELKELRYEDGSLPESIEENPYFHKTKNDTLNLMHRTGKGEKLIPEQIDEIINAPESKYRCIIQKQKK